MQKLDRLRYTKDHSSRAAPAVPCSKHQQRQLKRLQRRSQLQQKAQEEGGGDAGGGSASTAAGAPTAGGDGVASVAAGGDAAAAGAPLGGSGAPAGSIPARKADEEEEEDLDDDMLQWDFQPQPPQPPLHAHSSLNHVTQLPTQSGSVERDGTQQGSWAGAGSGMQGPAAPPGGDGRPKPAEAQQQQQHAAAFARGGVARSGPPVPFVVNIPAAAARHPVHPFVVPPGIDATTGSSNRPTPPAEAGPSAVRADNPGVALVAKVAEAAGIASSKALGKRTRPLPPQADYAPPVLGKAPQGETKVATTNVMPKAASAAAAAGMQAAVRAVVPAAAAGAAGGRSSPAPGAAVSTQAEALAAMAARILPKPLAAAIPDKGISGRPLSDAPGPASASAATSSRPRVRPRKVGGDGAEGPIITPHVTPHTCDTPCDTPYM